MKSGSVDGAIGVGGATGATGATGALGTTNGSQTSPPSWARFDPAIGGGVKEGVDVAVIVVEKPHAHGSNCIFKR